MAIRIRRGTNAEWESNNSNIVVGEPAIVTDVKRFFVGTASGHYAEFANLDIIAPAYNTSTSYVVGDVINRQGKLYSCNTPCSGVFNASYWDEKSLAEILKDLENEINYAQYEIGYADGELITINNGASEIPVKDLTVDIEAVQDLHGYDHPWAGGAGINKMPTKFYSGLGYNNAVGTQITLTELNDVTQNGNTFSRTVSGWSGMAMVSEPLPLGTYRLLANATSTSMRATRYILNSDLTVSRVVGNFTSSPASLGTTYTLVDDEKYIAISVQSSEAGTVTIETPQVAVGTDYVEYQPYSNICPISGWTGCEVTRTGKNLWTDDFFATQTNPLPLDTDPTSPYYGMYGGTSFKKWANHYSPSGSGMGSVFGFPINFGQLTVSFNHQTTGSTGTLRVYFLYDDGTSAYNGNITVTSTLERSSRTSDPSKNCVGAFIQTSSGESATGYYIGDVQFEVSDVETAYEPYNGTTYSVTWQTEAGTVYGGTLDVTTGVLTVDKAMLDGNLFTSVENNLSGDGSSAYVALTYTDFKAPNYFMKTNCLSRSNENWNKLPAGSISISNTSYIVVCSNVPNQTLAQFKTWFNENVQLMLELATPQTVQLTPTQVRTVLGTNNIWNDMGSNNELAYHISNALN